MAASNSADFDVSSDRPIELALDADDEDAELEDIWASDVDATASEAPPSTIDPTYFMSTSLSVSDAERMVAERARTVQKAVEEYEKTLDAYQRTTQALSATADSAQEHFKSERGSHSGHAVAAARDSYNMIASRRHLVDNFNAAAGELTNSIKWVKYLQEALNLAKENLSRVQDKATKAEEERKQRVAEYKRREHESANLQQLQRVEAEGVRRFVKEHVDAVNDDISRMSRVLRAMNRSVDGAGEYRNTIDEFKTLGTQLLALQDKVNDMSNAEVYDQNKELVEQAVYLTVSVKGRLEEKRRYALYLAQQHRSIINHAESTREDVREFLYGPWVNNKLESMAPTRRKAYSREGSAAQAHVTYQYGRPVMTRQQIAAIADKAVRLAHDTKSTQVERERRNAEVERLIERANAEAAKYKNSLQNVRTTTKSAQRMAK